MERVLKIGCLVVGLLCAIVIGPWVIIWALLVAEDVSHNIALRRYTPTSLADAVAYQYATPDLVAGFIDRGADVNQTVAAGNGSPPIPLIADACARGNVDVARRLLHRGARIADANIWSCARNGNEDMTRMLVEEGARLGRQPVYEDGIGPELIQAAAFGGQAWLVRLIAKKGADVQIVNTAGEGLLALALESEYRRQCRGDEGISGSRRSRESADRSGNAASVLGCLPRKDRGSRSVARRWRACGRPRKPWSDAGTDVASRRSRHGSLRRCGGVPPRSC